MIKEFFTNLVKRNQGNDRYNDIADGQDTPNFPSWYQRRLGYQSDISSRKVTSEELYVYSSIVLACIRLISEACSSLPMRLEDRKGEPQEDHPVLDLLAFPSKTSHAKAFFYELFSWLIVDGNAYINAPDLDRATANLPAFAPTPTRLEILRAPDMYLEEKRNGRVYRYGHGIDQRTWETRPPYGFNPALLHLKDWNPFDNPNGVGRVVAAAHAAETHAYGAIWQRNMMLNAGRPDILVSIKDKIESGGFSAYTPEQLKEITREFNEELTGAHNAGKLMVTMDSTVQHLALSPREMDWTESREALAREVAIALGVPPQVIGLNPKNDTFANMREAKMIFFTQTAIPLAEMVYSALTQWLLPRYDRSTGMRLTVDTESLPQLALLREQVVAAERQKIEGAGLMRDFATINEAREMAGLPPKAGGDKMFETQPMTPNQNKQNPDRDPGRRGKNRTPDSQRPTK